MINVNANLLTLTMLVAALAASGTARAVDPIDCDAVIFTTVFTEAVDKDWMDDDNWTHGVPDRFTQTCIPADKTAQIIFDDTAECRSLWIAEDGKVEVIGDTQNPTSLTLYGDAWIDGELELRAAPKLKLNGSITITSTDGHGGSLALIAETDFEFPEIKKKNESGTLTLNGANAGSWTPDEWEEEYQTDTLVLWGGGEISVPLVNNAHITTRNAALLSTDDSILTISGGCSGDGFWITQKNGSLWGDMAILDVTDEACSGSGTWVVAKGVCVGGTSPDDECDDHSDCPGTGGTCVDSSEIRINEACTFLTGDVIMEGGELNLFEDFTTSGTLTLTGGEIWLESGNAAFFD